MKKSSVHEDGNFQVFAPVSFFEKASAPEGEQRRIGGVISTETRDRENEVLLQRGLDFTDFLSHGFFNDNHGKAIADVVGEPDPSALRYFNKGELLPDGTRAQSNCHWAEGWLYADDPRADAIWKKAMAMKKAQASGRARRRLGFSVEGKIQKRDPADPTVVVKARVKHVAVTHMPMNADTTLDVLAKSMAAAAADVTKSLPQPSLVGEHVDIAALGGDVPGYTVAPAGSRTNPEEGDDDAPFDTVAEQTVTMFGHTAEDAQKVHMDGVVDADTLVPVAAPYVPWISKAQARFPGISENTARRIVRLAAMEATMSTQNKTPDEGALKKSLDALEAMSRPSGARRTELLNKALTGSATAAEEAELGALLKGTPVPAAPTPGSAADVEENLSKSMDVTPFIDHLKNDLAKSMVDIAAAVESNSARSQEQSVVLAKGLVDIGRAVAQIAANQAELAKSLEALSRQPAPKPASPIPTAPAAPTPGAPAGERRLQKSQVLDLLHEMLIESERENRAGLSKSGANITNESASYEVTNQFTSPAFEAEVIDFAKRKF